MFTETHAKLFRKIVEPEHGNDIFNYERWEGTASALCTFLGILRGITEGDFSAEDRAKAVAASELEFRILEDCFPDEERQHVRDVITGLRKSNPQNENFLREAIGERIRFANAQVIGTAPDENARKTMDAERKAAKEHLAPSHLWLNGFEAMEISDRLGAILDDPTAPASPADVFSSIGALQRLLVIVEKLRERIDDGSIPVADRDTDESIAQITTARDSIIRALVPINEDTAATSTPDYDAKILDSKALDNAWDIAGWLSDTKMRSV